MKLYCISATNGVGWDEYEGFVVAVESEDEISRYKEKIGGEWRDIKVKYIGEADSAVEKGIILTAFHAG